MKVLLERAVNDILREAIAKQEDKFNETDTPDVPVSVGPIGTPTNQYFTGVGFDDGRDDAQYILKTLQN